MIRALIVDDEPPARRHVSRLLQGWPQISVVGEASDGAQAVHLIKTLNPDLVFLDIQMPEMGGLDVISAVGADFMPATVFTTAYDAYAIQAFEAEALDYLLKPFDDHRFDMALKRVVKRLVSPPSHLLARMHGKTRAVPLNEIDWLGVAGDYVEAHAGERSLLLDGSLTGLLGTLPPDQFAQIHRTAIVRLDRITEMTGTGHGDAWLSLRDGTRLKLSRRYRENLAAWFAGRPSVGQ